MQVAHGGVHAEGPGQKTRDGEGLSDLLLCHQRGGDGNPVHPGTASRLAREGISTAGKYAVQLKRTDYDRYDYFLGMDQWNVRNMKRILGGDPENKVHLLLDFTGRPGEEIADPWYTGDFERTYADILEGCTGFLRQLEGQGT